jgi:hypothetical protein
MGGFGTLLKGQSRQAANKTTLDFGSCRDLQGRRLRTVNDEIGQRLRREWQQRVDTGQATKQEMIQALSDTSSGIAGWYLQLPAWAEKGSRKVARRQHHLQFRTWKRQEQEQLRQKELRRQAEDRVVEQYVQSTQRSLKVVTSHLQQAVQQGLVAAAAGSPAKDRTQPPGQEHEREQKARKRKLPSEEEDDIAEPEGVSERALQGVLAEAEDVDGPTSEAYPEEGQPTSSSLPSALVTLSGEVVQVSPEDEGGADGGGSGDSGHGGTRLRGASNFATVGVLLRGDSLPDSAEDGTMPPTPTTAGSAGGGLYYEVVVLTGGLVQVGWITDPDGLDSEAGDGVGDAPGSWSYDGSRQVKLHAPSSSSAAAAAGTASVPTTAASAEYGLEWKEGDVVGCLWRTDGSVQYFVNGADQGVAFGGACVGGPPHDRRPVVPAVSLNFGEAIEVRLNRTEFRHFAEIGCDATPVGEVLLEQVLRAEGASSRSPSGPSATEEAEKEPPLDGTHREAIPPAAAAASSDREPDDAGPIDLDDFGSAEALEEVGLDRLKRALALRGLKGGGTAKERAVRLFSVKGASPEDYPKKILAKK